jgi:Cytochrome c7 and related cytochrome c/Class III cytochrome C family
MTDKPEARRPWWRWAIVLVLPLIVVSAAALAVQNRATAEATPPTASIQFNHQKHVAAGAPCLFCHPGALNGTVATIPSVQKCMGCHNNVQVTSAKGQAVVDQLVAAWQAGQPLVWPKVVDLPDFVYFAHRPHIAAGKNCENCHGDVSQMTMARLAYRINMGFCLQNCHRHEDATRRERLMNCTTCHQ